VSVQAIDLLKVHRGLTTKEVAQRFRVNPDKVRAWIHSGELHAVNTSVAGKDRYIITPEALAAFEQARSAARPAPQPPQRRPRKLAVKDYYPAA
jgi:excisionase family DNA binding protein